ncbi:MAG TPA: PocR ligand-binding domain-containing protein [bacterium]
MCASTADGGSGAGPVPSATPSASAGSYRLQDLLDLEQFQRLQDSLNAVCPFPSAIIDNDGTILTATAWQDVCTKFHRVNELCAAECRKSDQYIRAHLREANPAVTYRCPHGLVDNAVPIVVEGVHRANFFTGQFFLEPPDLDFFRAQAARFGFDEAAYLDAVRRVPVWSRPQLDAYLRFIKDLIDVIVGIGLKNLRAAQTETMISGILNAVPQSIFWKDRAGVYRGCNEPFARAVGLGAPERIIGKTDYDLPWPRSEADAYRADDLEVINGSRPKRHIIEPLQQSDGSRLWIDTTKVPLAGADGATWGVLGVYEDVTERKRAEEALQERERQLAESQRIAHIGSWQHNLATGEVVWSDELFRILGLDPRTDKADINEFFGMIHPEDRPMVQRAVGETLRLGTRFSVDYRFVLRGGAVRAIHAEAELLADATGNEVILSGTAQDFTGRKEAEDQLRQNEEFIRGILDTVDEGFIVLDRDYRILSANKAYCRQVGCCEQEIPGMRCYEVSHRSDRPCFEKGEECPVREAFATGQPHGALHRHVDPHGGTLYVGTKAYPVKDEAGNVLSVIETVNNITERHLLEQERLKTQKLESIGTLAGGIAHDFNNLLQGLFGYISLARLSLDQPERVEAMLSQAEEALHVTVNLTGQLLTFSKGGKPRKRLIRLEPVVENAVRFALSGSSISHTLEVTPDLWPAEADAGQLAQVIQNIVLNADDAMGGHGSIDIRLENVPADGARAPTLPAEGRFVRIAIRDNGSGIPPENLERIFDPYFTTKTKGSGLGLATSYSIVRGHGGVIDVDSEPGRGSTFSVYLPAADGAAPAERAAPAAAGTAARGRILLMDDEPLVRDVATEMIGALGHEVRCAADGETAVTMYRRARESGEPFDVVILDLTIRGGMGGEEALRQIKAVDPGAVAVVSSGYADKGVVADFRTFGFSASLNKPYRMEALRDLLDSLIGKSAAPTETGAPPGR